MTTGPQIRLVFRIRLLVRPDAEKDAKLSKSLKGEKDEGQGRACCQESREGGSEGNKSAKEDIDDAHIASQRAALRITRADTAAQIHTDEAAGQTRTDEE